MPEWIHNEEHATQLKTGQHHLVSIADANLAFIGRFATFWALKCAMTQQTGTSWGLLPPSSRLSALAKL